MPTVQLTTPEKPDVMYSPALWLFLGLLLGWLLCKGGVG